MKPVHRLLEVSNLEARAGGVKILDGIDFSIDRGEVVAIMGQNGSGKSTFAHVIMGNPSYTASGSLVFCGKKILSLPTQDRARLGIFLGFQSPVAIPGVSVANIIHETGVMGKKNGKNTPLRYSDISRTAADLGIPEKLLSRGIHDGFSGGERKKIELLQAVLLRPKLALFDELDTGVDVDALSVMARVIGDLAKSGTGIIVISHNTRILRHLPVSRVVVFAGGRIVHSGGPSVIDSIEAKGFSQFIQESTNP